VGSRLCKFNGVGVMREASGTGTGPNESPDRIGLVVVCVGWGRESEPGLARGRRFGGKKGAPRRQEVSGTE